MLNTYKGNRFLPIRDKAILCIHIDTGIRCSELLNLKITDISDNHLTIREPKSRRDRIVAFSPYNKKNIGRYIRCRESYFVNNDIYENEKTVERAKLAGYLASFEVVREVGQEQLDKNKEYINSTAIEEMQY